MSPLYSMWDDTNATESMISSNYPENELMCYSVGDADDGVNS